MQLWMLAISNVSAVLKISFVNEAWNRRVRKRMEASAFRPLSIPFDSNNVLVCRLFKKNARLLPNLLTAVNFHCKPPLISTHEKA